MTIIQNSSIIKCQIGGNVWVYTLGNKDDKSEMENKHALWHIAQMFFNSVKYFMEFSYTILPKVLGRPLAPF